MHPYRLRSLLRTLLTLRPASGPVAAATLLAACGGAVEFPATGDAGHQDAAVDAGADVLVDGSTDSSPDTFPIDATEDTTSACVVNDPRIDRGDAGASLCSPLQIIYHCDLGVAGLAVGTMLPQALCTDSRVCGNATSVISCDITSQSPTTVNCNIGCPGGRRIEGMHLPDVRRFFARGLTLAEAARFEAGSVVAFRRLKRELHALGAPRTLRSRLGRAARDERRHARSTAQLARKYGAAPMRVEHDATPRRTLEAIALENATEGLVGEAFAAVVAAHQAACAQDAEVRTAMATIAREEAEHATLSAELARWIAPRLDVPARARVEIARQRAIDSLLAALESDDAPPADPVIGTPDRRTARALAGLLFAS
ncbi:MAG: ferritin-like domain-containing protein [Polyangiales bacterium]